MRNIIRKSTKKGVSNYTYDKAYRLTGATHPTLTNETFSYDKVGNRLSSASTAGNWTYNNSDQLLTTPTNSYDYTANGNTKKITPADTTQKASEYLYDARDRLAEVKKDNAILQSNRYDFAQRRIAKTTASATTYYLYGQTGLLAEYQSNGDFIQGYGYNPKGSYTTNPHYTITPATGTGYDFDFYHNDHLATPQKLTNSTGAVSWAMENNAFGETTIKTQATINNLRFPGQYYDTDIGLSQNYFRDYAPNLGRYVETDPIGLDGGVNSYLYIRNKPNEFIDSFGLIESPMGTWNRMAQPSPPPNGPFGPVCGGEGAWTATWLIPDGIFKNACQRHDDCYNCSGIPQDICDDIFCIELQNACTRYTLDVRANAICRSAAGLYCVAVKKKGEEYYKEKGTEKCPECEENQE